MEPPKPAKLEDILSRALGTRSQEWLGEQVGVSQARISQWLTGTDIPPAFRLALLASALKLDPNELRAAAGYKTEETLYLFESHFSQASFLDLLESHRDQVKAISDFWESGAPNKAKIRALSLVKTLKEESKHYSASKLRAELLYVRSAVLCELGCAYTVSLTALDALPYLEQVANQQFSIAAELAASKFEDAIPLAHAYRSLGDAHYALRNCEKARMHYSDALYYEKDENRRIEIVRALALTAAYADNQKQFESVDRQIKICLEANASLGLKAASTLLEAEGRSQALFHDPECWHTLREAAEIIKKAGTEGELLICRMLQSMRSKIVAALYLEGEDINTEGITHEIKDAISVASLHGYLKYIEEIRLLLVQFARRHPHFSFATSLLRMFFPPKLASTSRSS